MANGQLPTDFRRRGTTTIGGTGFGRPPPIAAGSVEPTASGGEGGETSANASPRRDSAMAVSVRRGHAN